MVVPAIWLGALGLADLVAGLAGTAVRRRRAAFAWAVAVVAAATATVAFGYSYSTAAVATLTVAATAAAWLAARPGPRTSAVAARRTLCIAAVVTLTVVATSGAWPERPADALADDWFLSLDGELTHGIGLDRLAVLAAAFLFVQASANTLVRLLLAATGVRTAAAERRLAAGRVIGALERTLILGFAVAGEPTAAALVVSAKTLLRFPEMGATKDVRRSGADDQTPTIDEITEYLVVGSLGSWLLALAPTLLIGG